MTADVCWRPPDNFLQEPAPPFRNSPADRSREGYIAAIEQFRVTESFRYQRRDVTGDGVDDTFCNVFAADVTAAMGCPLPRQRANQQADWLEVKGPKRGWVPVSASKAYELVEAGCPVVAVWKNPDPEKSGHIAVVRPAGVVASKQRTLRIAQAGRRNFNDGPLPDGFGVGRLAKLYAHP